MLCSHQLYHEFVTAGVPAKVTLVIKGKKNKKHVPLVPDRHLSYGEMYLLLPGHKVTKYSHGQAFKPKGLVDA